MIENLFGWGARKLVLAAILSENCYGSERERAGVVSPLATATSTTTYYYTSCAYIHS